MDSSNFDRQHDVHYLNHLAEVNEQQTVVAAEDIYNQFGVVLIAKGRPISRQVAERIRQHRLQKPLDDQVELESSLTAQQVLNDIHEFLEQHPDFLVVHRANDFDAGLRHLCLARSIPKQLRQRLSVMKRRMPEEYQHGLFCAWICGLLAKELKLAADEAANAFTCGLVHDLGILHLPPQLWSRQGPFDEAEWRAVQSHVVVGKLIIDALDYYPPALGVGVLEHHERLDRTGYPSCKPASKLGLLGQMVGMADLVHKLVSNELAGQGRPLSACLAYLKVNHRAYRDDLYGAMFRILSKAAEQAMTVSDPGALVERTLRVNNVLNQLTLSFQTLYKQQLAGKTTLRDSSIEKLAEMIFDVFNSAGLDHQALKPWLESGIADDAAEPPADAETAEDPDQDQAAAEEQAAAKAEAAKAAHAAEQADWLRALVETDNIQYELLWLYKRLIWGVEQVLESPEMVADLDTQALAAFADETGNRLQDGWAAYHPPE